MPITLYVKTHNKTGLKYFGKTVQENVDYYQGSGLYWRRHLAVHGYDVTTTVLGVFEDAVECSKLALKFSVENNIVESDEWANLIAENGLDGAPHGHTGHVFTEAQLEDMSRKLRLRWECPNYRTRTSASQAASWTVERRAVQAEDTRERWTPERREAHSALLSSLLAEKPEWSQGFMEYVKQPERPEAHGRNISKALTGVPKSPEHRLALSWNKILKNNPDLPFTSYSTFSQHCLSRLQAGVNRHQISKELGVSHKTVSKAIAFAELHLPSLTKGT